jgi:UDP-glucose 6-dehydrogenase
MANLCESYRADINDVRRGIGHDQRIGFHFLHPGVGYGGSCFPKDIRAVVHMARSRNIPARMMEAVDEVNEKPDACVLKVLLNSRRQRNSVERNGVQGVNDWSHSRKNTACARSYAAASIAIIVVEMVKSATVVARS